MSYTILDEPAETYLDSPDPPEDLHQKDAWLGSYQRNNFYQKLSPENKTFIALVKIDSDGIDYKELAELANLDQEKVFDIMSFIPGRRGGEEKRFYSAALALLLYMFQ